MPVRPVWAVLPPFEANTPLLVYSDALLAASVTPQSFKPITGKIHLPEDKRDMLKIVASIEKRDMQTILSDLIDEYLERNKETLEILSNPQWADTIREGLRASERGETIRWRNKKSGKSS